jgi:LacI family transcriptional regulator, repressor for deo operon, udp, cdd, tsx, nupC, and nupG
MRNVGLVLVQSAPRVAYEPLISGIGHGLEEMFVKSGMCLVTRVVRDRSAELDVYRYWHASGAVDAVILVRLRQDDERITFLKQLKIPFAAIADTLEVGDFSAVTIDSASMMREAVAYLTSRGHADIAYVKAPEDTVLSDVRTRMFLQEARSSGFRGRVVSTELTEDGSHEVTTRLMSEGDNRPTAVIYDDDVTAVAGLETIQSLGLAVPEGVAVMAWNDSVRCQSATPPVTAMSDQAHRIGILAATCLIQAVESDARTIVGAPDSFIVQRVSA